MNNLPLIAHEVGHVVEMFFALRVPLVTIADLGGAGLVAIPQGANPSPAQQARNCLHGPAVGYWFRALAAGATTEDLTADYMSAGILDRVMADAAVSQADREAYRIAPPSDALAIVISCARIAGTFHREPTILHSVAADLQRQGYAELANPSAVRH